MRMIDGIVAYAADGFSRDANLTLPDGSFELAISGRVAGPVAAPAVVPEPYSVLLVLGALAGLVATTRRGRHLTGGCCITRTTLMKGAAPLSP